MAEDIEVFKTVCQRLQNAGIPYMVTGSVAANFYAQPRMTRDIDLVVQIEMPDALRLAALFARDFYVDDQAVMRAIAQQGMFNIIHNESLIKVDIIVRKNTEYREREFQRRCFFEVDGFPICVVAVEDLILSKLIWAKDSGSELQLGDVRNLLMLQKGLDAGYLDQWIARLGLQDIYSRVRL